MLYVTTRTDRDAFTPYRAMTRDHDSDGGQFLPRGMPRFDADALDALSKRSFHENVAHVLSLLYRGKLSGREIDLVLGKGTPEILHLNSRTMAAKLWRDADCTFAELTDRLFRLYVKAPEEKPGQWFTMSVRIAMLFAVFGQLMAKGILTEGETLDVAVPSLDFQAPMAVWYARAWGLPIGQIICACNENNAPWSLLHQGQMRTDGATRHTLTAACDQAVPAGLERLIHAALGAGEVERYRTAVSAGRPYKLTPEQHETLRAGISVCVVSQRRMEFMIPNIYRAGRWQPDLYAAMAYAALVDHRARAGETGKALLLCEEDPAADAGKLAPILGETGQKTKKP